MEGFPWDYLRKIFRECQRMANVQNAVEILRKISTAAEYGARALQTDRRQTNRRQHIANVNAYVGRAEVMHVGLFLISIYCFIKLIFRLLYA